MAARNPVPKIRQITHPTDLTQESEFAFVHALRLALASQARLDVLHVDRRAHAVEWTKFPSVHQVLRRWGVEPQTGSSREVVNGVHVSKVAVYGNEPVHPILAHLNEFPPDLIVLATHQREGLARWLYREVAQTIARERAVPTLFVPTGVEGFVSPSEGSLLLRHVLIPVDWQPAPQIVVDTAADLAATLGCEELEITLLHVGDRADEMPALELAERPGWSWRQRTVSGDVVEQVLAQAETLDADLVVMGTRGRDGFLDALRGSTTERVLRKAQCPVLAVPCSPYE